MMDSKSPTDSLPEQHELRPGQNVADRYEIIERIGEGGMCRVMKARDSLNAAPVALKFLLPKFAGDSYVCERLRREAAFQQKLDHPGIVKLIDICELNDKTPFIVVEYVVGRSLDELLTANGERGLDAREVADYLKQVALALDCAHKSGVVHRDLKPSNIMVTPEAAVKVADFGIARAIEGGEKFTRTGEFVGSIEYSSPEQCLGDKLDARSDVYSLGIVGFELLTGRLPFDHPNYPTLVYMHVNEPVPPFDTEGKEIPPSLEKAIRKALEKKPEDRFQTMQEFAQALADSGDDKHGLPRAKLIPAIVAVAVLVLIAAYLMFAW